MLLRFYWQRNRRVIGNFFSLSVVQFANYLAPLILIPYLTRVLGLPRYGLVELARAISVYFLMLTDYGFSLSAVREISVHRDDPKRISEVFSAVMTLKLLLVLLSLAILSVAVLAVPRLRADWPVYYLSFCSVLGMWLFPIWLFQGLERMKQIAVLSVAAKLLVIVATVVVVRDPDDYLYVPLLHSAGTILVGLAGLAMALRCFPVRFRRPSLAVLRSEFVSGWHLFCSKMATTFYTTSNVVILGLLSDNLAVAYYAAGDKIVRAATDGLQIPLSQAIFPHIGRLASQSKQAALRYAARVAGALGVVTLILSTALFLAAPQVARLAMGDRSQGGATVIRILAFLPFVVGMSNILGVQILVNFGLQRTLTKVLTVAGFLNLLVVVSLVLPLRHAGAAAASLTTEVFVTAVLLVVVRRNGLDVFRTRGGADAPRG